MSWAEYTNSYTSLVFDDRGFIYGQMHMKEPLLSELRLQARYTDDDT